MHGSNIHVLRLIVMPLYLLLTVCKSVVGGSKHFSPGGV